MSFSRFWEMFQGLKIFLSCQQFHIFCLFWWWSMGKRLFVAVSLLATGTKWLHGWLPQKYHFECRCSLKSNRQVCVSQPDISWMTSHVDRTQTCIQPAIPTPALPPTVPTSSSSQSAQTKKNKQERRETKDRKRMDGGGGRGQNAELEECHFLFTTKRGKERVSEKVSGCLTPSLLPLMAGVVSPPRPCWKGKHTHPLRICPLQPESSLLGTFYRGQCECAQST